MDVVMPKVICPKCGKSLKTLDTSVDVKARCSACKHIFMYKPRGTATPSPKEPAIKKPTLLIAGVVGLVFLVAILVLPAVFMRNKNGWQSMSPQELFDKASPAVVQVIARDGNSKVRKGSGLLIVILIPIRRL